MITTVTSEKAPSDPKQNYVIGLCDQCRRSCLRSKQPGKTAATGSDAAWAAAIKAGWKRVEIEDFSTNKPSWIVKLLCPQCHSPSRKVAADPARRDK